MLLLLFLYHYTLISLFDIVIEWLFPKEKLTKTFVVWSNDNNRMDENGGPYEVMIEDVEYLDNIGNL